MVWIKIENDTIILASEICTKARDEDFGITKKYTVCGYNFDSNSKMLFADGYQNISYDLYNLYLSGGAEIKNGKLKDITNTGSYKSKVSAAEKEVKKTSLQSQIDELDKKRIRAMCEPSIKDEATGQTWLEYYNLQVQELRTQINELG